MMIDHYTFDESDIVDISGVLFLFSESTLSVIPPHEDDPDMNYYWNVNWRHIYKIEYQFDELDEEFPYGPFMKDLCDLLSTWFGNDNEMQNLISGFAYIGDDLNEYNTVHSLIIVSPSIKDRFIKLIDGEAKSHPFYLRRLADDPSDIERQNRIFLNNLMRLSAIEGRPKALALGSIASKFL